MQTQDADKIHGARQSSKHKMKFMTQDEICDARCNSRCRTQISKLSEIPKTHKLYSSNANSFINMKEKRLYY